MMVKLQNTINKKGSVKMKQLEITLLNYMKNAIIDANQKIENMFFNFLYDESTNQVGNDLEEFLRNNKYSISDIHSSLDSLEEQGYIIKRGVFKTYGTIHLTDLVNIQN